jgi:hypothetical protein
MKATPQMMNTCSPVMNNSSQIMDTSCTNDEHKPHKWRIQALQMMNSSSQMMNTSSQIMNTGLKYYKYKLTNDE